MAAKHSRHIALTDQLASYVDASVDRGDYASASEMIRTALRLLHEREKTRTSVPDAVKTEPSSTAERPIRT